MKQEKIEIMAPVGSFESLHAALKGGCDSVYFGIEQLNMRARASNNFTTEDLKEIVKICKKHNVKTYLTLNTIMYDHDITLLHKICDTAKEANITAVIASDISAVTYASAIGLEIHMSTQVNITNIEAVKFYAKFADVMVLARELTLKQITHIVDEIHKQDIRGPKGNLIEIEIFVHGALCVAVSGKCYMSIATYNSSANRGACLQNCRRKYKLTDEETGDELVVDNNYIMSPSDLCTIEFIDKIIEAGVSVFKIEGRGKAPEYVYTVVKSYKEAVELYYKGEYTKEKAKTLKEEMGKVFNRGFWEGGYYLGKKLGEWSGVYGSKATQEKTYVGVAEHYYPKPQIVQVKVEAGEVKQGDEYIITGTTTGVAMGKVEKIFKHINNKPTEISVAHKGDIITFKVSERIREKDKVYIVKKVNPQETKTSAQ